MKWMRALTATTLAAAVVFGGAGCQKKEEATPAKAAHEGKHDLSGLQKAADEAAAAQKKEAGK